MTSLIKLHSQTGIKVAYDFSDEDGNPRDVSNVDVELRLSNGLTKTLTNGETTNEKILTLLGSEVPDLIGKQAQYIVIDKSFSPPAEVASGPVVVTGW